MALPLIGFVARAAIGSVSSAGGRAASAAAMGAVSRTLGAIGTPDIDVSMFGDKRLQRRLNRLDKKDSRKVVVKAFKSSAARAKRRVIQNLSGSPVQVRTGELRRAFEATKIRSGRGRGVIRYGVTVPGRAELGISEGDKSFYPYAVEYGHGNVPAYPYIRPAIDDHYSEEVSRIGRDIGSDLERRWRR